MDRVRVVIVDDGAEAREGLRSILASQPDIDVVGVADGAEATALIEELQPDLVLVDAQMPAMGGAEATRLIKRSAPRARVMVLAVHANDAELALESGADGTLMKDSPRQELLEAVRRIAGAGDPGSAVDS